jgi:hypothetical protein
MLVTRAQTAKMLSRLISDTFGDNLKSNVPEFTQVFDSEAMDRADVFETESVGTGYAGLIPEGRSVDYLGFGEGYTAHYRALKFGAGTQVTEEQVDDNLWMKMGAKAGVFLEESLRQTKELFHAQVFNDPTLLGGDGVALLSTAHPTVYGGTQSNTLAVPSQFSESALEEMLVKIRLCKDAAGLFKAIKPVKLFLHPSQEYNALRILNSVLRAGTTDNDVNVHKGLFSQGPVTLTWLTNTQYWGIKTNCPDGLKTLQRKAVRLKNSEDIDTGSVKTVAKERYARGWTNWRAWYGCAP